MNNYNVEQILNEVINNYDLSFGPLSCLYSYMQELNDASEDGIIEAREILSFVEQHQDEIENRLRSYFQDNEEKILEKHKKIWNTQGGQ